jgi:hypothetical protein
MLSERSSMKLQQCRQINPARFLHLAKARKIFRRLAMISNPTRTCSSTSGSYGVRRYPSGVSTAKMESSFFTRRRCRSSFGSITPVDVPTALSFNFIRFVITMDIIIADVVLSNSFPMTSRPVSPIPSSCSAPPWLRTASSSAASACIA